MGTGGSEFTKYLHMLLKRRGLFVASAMIITSAGLAIGYLLPKKYEAQSVVFIEKSVIADLVKGIAVTPSMDDTIKVLTHAITSRTLLQKVVGELDMDINRRSDLEREEMVRDLQKNTVVKIKDKNLFTISFRNNDPRIARDYVNALVRRYVEENISSKREESYGATSFLSEQIQTFREKLEKAEAEVNRYKTSNGAIIATDEGKLFQEINVAQQKLYDLQLRRRHLEALRNIESRSGPQAEDKRLVQLRTRLAELKLSYTDMHPEVVRVAGEIEDLTQRPQTAAAPPLPPSDPEAVAKMTAELDAIRITERGLNRYIETNKGLLRSIPSAKAGLEKLEIEKNNQKNLYDQLFARHGQSEVSKQMEVQDKTTTFRVVDPAILPIKPVSPDRVRVILMAIAAGLGGAFGLLLCLEQFDPRIKTVEALRDLGVPVIAVVPVIRTAEGTAACRRQKIRLLAVACGYFASVGTLLALEAAGLNPVERTARLLTGLL